MTEPNSPWRIDTPELLLEYSEAPWDTRVFGHPVLQITGMEVRGRHASGDFAAFEAHRDAMQACIASCRLAHDRLRESMLLEAHGFRFIEMVYQPELDLAGEPDRPDDARLRIAPAEEGEWPEVIEAAGAAFAYERFHMDHRLGRAYGNQRYRNWVQSSLGHPTQKLYAVREDSRLVAFVVLELQPEGTCYWHLTAIVPAFQGRGYGRRSWRMMLGLARELGAARVRTTISARNHRVLNLYARLGFRFSEPRMTFHWVRDSA